MGKRSPDSSMNSAQIDALVCLFTPRIFKELAIRGFSPALARLVRSTSILDQLPSGPASSLSGLFNAAYEIIKRPGNRSAYVYKNILARNRFLGRHSLATASMMTEYRVGQAKADVVILNGTSTCYEIKSERDGFTRLESQISAYTRVFDKTFVVAAECHLPRLLDVLPKNIGIMIVDSRSRLSEKREAESNKTSIDTSVLFDSLTILEIKSVFMDLGLSVPDLPNTKLRGEMKKQFTRLDPAEVHDATITAMLRHRSLKNLGEFIEALPASLTVAGISLSLARRARMQLINILQNPVSVTESWL
jgi:hypothetical protein